MMRLPSARTLRRLRAPKVMRGVGHEEKMMKNVIWAFAVSLVIGAVPLGAQTNNELTNVNWQAMLTAMSNTTPQEVDASTTILQEALAFFSSFTNLLPTKGTGKTLTLTPWPPTFAVKYPAEMRVEITAKDNIQPRLQYSLKKTALTSSWAITEGWVVSRNGKRTEALPIPNPDEQRVANTRIRDMMKQMQEESANKPSEGTR